jgi:hypothetical protein
MNQCSAEIRSQLVKRQIEITDRGLNPFSIDIPDEALSIRYLRVLLVDSKTQHFRAQKQRPENYRTFLFSLGFIQPQPKAVSYDGVMRDG